MLHRLRLPQSNTKKIQHERNDDEFGLYIIHCFHGTSFLTVLFLKVFFLYYDGIMIYDWIRFSYCKPKKSHLFFRWDFPVVCCSLIFNLLSCAAIPLTCPWPRCRTESLCIKRRIKRIKVLRIQFILYKIGRAQCFTKTLEMHNFTRPQETNRICNFRIFYQTKDVIIR